MKRVGIYFKESPETLAPTKSLMARLKKLGAQVLLLKPQARWLKLKGVSEKEFVSALDLLIAIGGDGTILSAARRSAALGIPILGVNLGRLGFLSEVNIVKARQSLPRILRRKYLDDTRMMIEAVVVRRGRVVGKTLALNEVVVGKTGIARMIHTDCFANGRLVASYDADGLIISTPTGSTGHNLSAGGPLLSPELRQVVVTAICPHAVGTRSIILGSTNSKKLLQLRVHLASTPGEGAQGILTADGQKMIPLEQRDDIVVQESPYRTRFVRLKPYDFMEVVRKKLGWGRGGRLER